MSRGFGAHADLVAQDNETVIYQYGGYNLNEPEFRNEKHLDRKSTRLNSSHPK